ncbi:tumor necrosis factor ligand superfamily member 10-like protein [Lates japonicus]|uniref:Tumor necrosis factor ligand superfamily member 10 n=1 Tax=Lates japonicus TaxID=270547 RepID=A0AAD3NNR4_LATJO|nr:tumor necrosis factor ligand superfamily member 10-like protein [Lates japonicus]
MRRKGQTFYRQCRQRNKEHVQARGLCLQHELTGAGPDIRTSWPSSLRALHQTEGIKAYISKVTENIISKQTFIEARTMPRPFNNSGSKFMTSVAQRPSAHLTLRDTSSQGLPPYPIPTPGLHQSCRHVVRSWANQSFGAHLHNMTLSNGKLRVPQDGRYYLYSQVYFRYPSPAASDGDQRSVSHQLVQCVYKKTSYPSPIQLLKGVGTKCWAPDAEYALHSVYQGGLFELRAGGRTLCLRLFPHHG